MCKGSLGARLQRRGMCAGAQPYGLVLRGEARSSLVWCAKASLAAGPLVAQIKKEALSESLPGGVCRPHVALGRRSSGRSDGHHRLPRGKGHTNMCFLVCSSRLCL